MIRNPNKNKVLWRLTAVLSLIAALVGVFNPVLDLGRSASTEA